MAVPALPQIEADEVLAAVEVRPRRPVAVPEVVAGEAVVADVVVAAGA